MKKFENKVAVVTGASKGIGAAIAPHLASEGADKVVNEIVSKGGDAIAVKANVSKQVDIDYFDQLFHMMRNGRLG